MNQFTTLQAVISRGGVIVDSSGRPTTEFLKLLQGWENKVKALDLQAQFNGQIASSANISGRTEGIGTTVSNLDSAGVVTDNGVDLSRSYLNKSLASVPDSSLRKAMTPAQANYVAVASVVSSGQSGVARPTAFFDLGTSPTINPELAFDALDGTTAAAINGGGALTGRCSYRGFIKPSSALASATLTLKSSLSTSSAPLAEARSFAGLPPRGILHYSLDGGSTWNTVYSLTADRPITTDTIALLPSQDLSLIWVDALIDTSAGMDDYGELDLYDAFVDYKLA